MNTAPSFDSKIKLLTIEEVKKNLLLDRILNSLTEGLAFVNKKGECVFLNSAALELIGYSASECLGKNLHDLIHYQSLDGKPISANECETYQGVAKGKKTSLSEQVYFKKDGSPFYALSSFSPLVQNGRFLGGIIVLVDNTERKELEKRKDEFISIASHELKTPLSSIKGYAQILETFFQGNEKADYYISKMNNQIDRISQLVNDLLDVSKIQSGKLELQKEKINLNNLISEVVEDLQQMSSNHTLEIDIIGKSPPGIMLDKFRFSQVLINLISNAVKYSPRSNQVKILVAYSPEDVSVTIKDFGIGITQRDLNRIFEPFFQASNKIRQSFSGLGLGLYISLEIIKRHGGTISVKSKKGEGTEFVIKMPI